jgi:hypothetical protein
MPARFYLKCLTGFVLFLTGCIPPAFVTHPQIAQRAGQIRKIALLPPRVSVYEIGAGGVTEKIDEWSQAGARNVLKALESQLALRAGVQVKIVDPDKLPNYLKVELEQTELLFDAVSASVVWHVYGLPAQRFEEKWTNFDYSLGNDTAKLNAVDADVFVLVKGVDHISSPGRQALQVTTMLAAAAMGIAIIPQGGVTALNMALVDARSGDILWYVATRSDGGSDLRNPSSSAAFVKNALNGFPIR